MSTIINPVLRGFHPDPCMIRVGDDYYIATSTFQWFPGVLISHSKDLVNWHPIKYPLDRLSQLDMRGEGNSMGIWAPCLPTTMVSTIWFIPIVSTLVAYSKICIIILLQQQILWAIGPSPHI